MRLQRALLRFDESSDCYNWRVLPTLQAASWQAGLDNNQLNCLMNIAFKARLLASRQSKQMTRERLVQLALKLHLPDTWDNHEPAWPTEERETMPSFREHTQEDLRILARTYWNNARCVIKSLFRCSSSAAATAEQ